MSNEKQHQPPIHRDKSPPHLQPCRDGLKAVPMATCHRPNHPGSKHLALPAPPRNLKPSIQVYESYVKNKLDSGLDVKHSIKEIHIESVSSTISTYPPNKVLLYSPPEISKAKLNLNQQTRTTLSRLRSGYCRSLNSYMSLIDVSIQDVCSKCNTGPHNTAHLFNCPANPTDLSPSSLWTHGGSSLLPQPPGHSWSPTPGRLGLINQSKHRNF